MNVDDFSSSSEYDSDELDQNNTENPHGFVYGSMLETYTKNRKERIAQWREVRDENYEAHRDKFKIKKESKNIGKSEKMHQKNKPFMMMKKKKILENARKFDTKINQKKERKTQLGHFRKSTQQRLEAKKRSKK